MPTVVAPVTKTRRIAGAVLTAIVALFLTFDTVLKVLKLAPAIDGTTALGYPANRVFPIGVIELVCLVLYLIPRTAVLGAVLIAGYLGGATATHVRVGDAGFFAPTVLGVLAWLGLWLREPRLRALIPFRSK